MQLSSVLAHYPCRYLFFVSTLWAAAAAAAADVYASEKTYSADSSPSWLLMWPVYYHCRRWNVFVRGLAVHVSCAAIGILGFGSSAATVTPTTLCALMPSSNITRHARHRFEL